jgi:pimeloyl-ACP methyl ester carboxylesterase
MPTIERGGLSWHVQLLGEGPPLAMLHGLLVGSMASWYFGAAPRLARRHRVLLHDLRGHGLSSHAARGYDLATLGDDLDGLLPLAGDGPVTLVGHSWGALTALRFAIARPGRVRRLILIEAPMPPSNLPELQTFLATPPEQMVSALPVALQGSVAGGSRTGKRLVAQLQRLALESSLLSDVAGEPDIGDDELARLDLPVLCVYGDRSGCRPAGERLARAIPGARLEILSGGHFLPAEAAEPLGALLEREVDG